MRHPLQAESGVDSAMENPQVQSTRYSSLRLDRTPSPRSLYRSSSRHNSSNDVSRTTTPIAMPSSNVGHSDHRPHPLAIPPSAILDVAPHRFTAADNTASPIAKAARARRTSISFDPKVKLDGGQQVPLQEPLSRVSAEYFSLSDPASLPPPPPPSSQDNHQSNLSVGLGMYPRKSSVSSSLFVKPSEGSSRPRRRRTSAASKFLGLSTESEHPTSPIAITNSAVSLTSNSTVSSMTEFSTPPDSVNEESESIVGSPESIPVLHGIDPTAWPSPFSSPSSPFGPRNKSFTHFEPHRTPSSRARRAMSERGGGRRGSVSSGISPASMFLSNINSSPKEEPSIDAEGLEISDYVLGKQISFGGFSSVSEAVTIEGGVKMKYAVKIVRRHVSADQEDDLTSFEQEVDLWRVLHHRHILPLVAVINAPLASYAVMEFASGGSLFDLIKKNRQGISASRCQHYGFQLASALRYLHEDMHIIHGDVKLENCLLDMSRDREAGGHLYLADFGLARHMSNPHEEDSMPEIHRSQTATVAILTGASQTRPQNQRTHSLDASNFAGSLPYASPEMINSVGPVSQPSVDIWAFAATIFTLHTGTLPFNHSFQPKLQDMILKGEYDIEKLRKCWGLMEAGKEESDRVEEVVKGCLVVEPERRWGVRDVLESRWLRDMREADDE